MAPRRRWVSGLAATVGLMVLLTACGGNASPDDAGGRPATEPGVEPNGGLADAPTPEQLPQAVSSPREDVPSALRDMADDAFPDPLIDPAEILSGGPPPDGRPAIDKPTFERVADVDWLTDNEAVLAVEIDGDARAYPYQIMTWHENAQQDPYDCASCETTSGRVDHIVRTVHFDGDLDAAQRARLLEIANKCPVRRTLHSEVVVQTVTAESNLEAA